MARRHNEIAPLTFGLGIVILMLGWLTLLAIGVPIWGQHQRRERKQHVTLLSD